MVNFARKHSWIVSPFSGMRQLSSPIEDEKGKDPREREKLSLRGSRIKLNEVAKYGLGSFVTLQAFISAGAED